MVKYLTTVLLHCPSYAKAFNYSSSTEAEWNEITKHVYTENLRGKCSTLEGVKGSGYA